MLARFGASVGLLTIVLAGAVLLGGAVAAWLLVTVDDTPAAEQAATEAADVELVRCGQTLRRMTASLRVVNGSSGPSDYFIDLEFVRRRSREVIEVVPLVVEDLAPGDAERGVVASTGPPPPAFSCRVGDVDRLSA